LTASLDQETQGVLRPPLRGQQLNSDALKGLPIPDALLAAVPAQEIQGVLRPLLRGQQLNLDVLKDQLTQDVHLPAFLDQGTHGARKQLQLDKLQ
jgi:hypothetical protein